MVTRIPLAERLRPKSLLEYVGQQHIIGDGSVLYNAIKRKNIPSMILWGPPGVGKTSLANLIARELGRPFFSLSAIKAGVKEVREVIEKPEQLMRFNQEQPVLFIDEIHRFSKSQQDSLLGAVEKGVVTLIGATTENPSFEVISALLSRCQVYVLENLSEDDLKGILNRAMTEDDFLKNDTIDIQEYEALFRLSGGDARRLLNVFELVVDAAVPYNKAITNDFVFNRVKSC